MQQRVITAATLLLFLLCSTLLVFWWMGATREPSAPSTNETPAPQVHRLRFGHNIPEDSALHLASLRYAEEVERSSGGRVQVTVFPAQQLGNDHQMVEMARAGELDILLTPTAKLSVPVPAMQYADLPFYFPTPEDLYAMLDGEPGRLLLEKLRAIDLIGVTFWENGFKHFTANRPILGPEDFQGLKIRTMKSRILMEQFEAFGAHPVPIDFHATRQALADGVVDGQENPLIAIVSMGFHEVQSDLTLSNHGYLGYVLSISEKVFERLPPDLRRILVETGRELTPWERDETHRRERELLEIMRVAGVRIHTLDEGARRGFAERTAQLPARFEEVIGADLLSKTQELLRAKYAPSGAERESIVIALDADLSMAARVSGLAIKRGAMLAVEEINARGGVLGRRLELFARDHKALPTQGVTNIGDFAADPRVVAVVGGLQSAVVSAEIETIQQAGLPFLAAWSSAAELVENGHEPNYVFRVSANDRLAGPFLIDRVLERYRHPAILLENSIWGRGNLRTMTDYLQRQGLGFVRVEQFNRGEREFVEPLRRIREAGADAIVLIANPNEGRLLLEALASEPGPLPVISHWGILGGSLWEESSEAVQAVDLSFLQTVSLDDAGNPRATALAERYLTRFGGSSPREIRAGNGVAHAYDLVHLLALAIERAGTTERSAVRDALERLAPYGGVVRDYAPAFTPQRHDALSLEDYHLARFASDGAIERLPDAAAGPQ